MNSPTAVLADRLPAPNKTLTRDIALILGGAAATALAAQINIPFQPVPFTLQTMAVAACGLVLGAKRGALSQATYVLAGTLGAPVFAEFKAGPAVIAGPTGGYLLAFILGAFLAGLAAERKLDRKVATCLLSLCGVMATILLIGGSWLAVYLGGNLSQAGAVGVLPFIPSGILKSAALAFGLPITWRLLPEKPIQ